MITNKIILFGKSGFVSSNFQQLLKSKKLKFKAIGSKDINLLSIKSSKKLIKFNKKNNEYIIYFFSALTPDKGKDEFTFLKNIQMISNFFKFFPNKKISRFIYISSDAVYGNSEIINDKTKPSPVDLYGYMHLIREQIIALHLDKKNICILRPTAIFGVGDTHNSYGPNRFYKQSNDTSKITLFGKGLDIRDHLYIKDFCLVLFKLFNKKINGTYPIASETSYSFVNVAEIIKYYFKTQKNTNIKIEFIPNNSKPSKKNFSSLVYKKLFKIKSSPFKKSILHYFK